MSECGVSAAWMRLPSPMDGFTASPRSDTAPPSHGMPAFDVEFDVSFGGCRAQPCRTTLNAAGRHRRAEPILGLPGLRRMMQLAYRPGQACRAHEPTARLQPVQLAAQLTLIMLVHRLLDRVTHPRQLGQEQFAQGDQVVALAIERGQCRCLVPVLYLQLDRCRGRATEIPAGLFTSARRTAFSNWSRPSGLTRVSLKPASRRRAWMDVSPSAVCANAGVSGCERRSSRNSCAPLPSGRLTSISHRSCAPGSALAKALASESAVSTSAGNVSNAALKNRG